jgi:hypothetical protein
MHNTFLLKQSAAAVQALIMAIAIDEPSIQSRSIAITMLSSNV